MSSNSLKHDAAVRAVDFVQSGQVLGLGTGSTVRFVLEELAQRLRDGRLRGISGVPTSEQTARLSDTLGIPLVTLDQEPALDLTIDGADEVDPSLDLIKGLGGALLREKIVASASRELLIVADESKLVRQLGEKVAVPVEVIRLAIAVVERHIERLGRTATLRRDRGTGQAYITDEGNYILDVGGGPIRDPYELERNLQSIPGVVGHGLFLAMATMAVVAGADGVKVRSRVDPGVT